MMNIQNRLKGSFFIFFLIFFVHSSFAQNHGDAIYSLNSSENVRWYIKGSEKGDDVLNIINNKNLKEWIPSTVPGTFFVDFVNAGIEKDPNWGDNIYQVDKDKYNKSYWYMTEFEVPVELSNKFKNIWLNFDGINRTGTIYLNGKKLEELRGFMMRGRYNISDLMVKNGKNILLVLVSVPNQKRHPEEKFANMASPTYLSSAGWDWMPSVPGLNSGITDKVYLAGTQDVTIVDPWMQTKLLNKNKMAELELSTTLENNSSQSKKIKLICSVNPGHITFSKEFTIAPNAVQDITFNARNESKLRIENPKLWWPNGFGDPFLYECKLEVEENNKISDTKILNFGIREYSYHTEQNNVFHVYVNGEKVFLKGGNWGMSEYLLRCRGDEYATKIKLHKEMNFNIIRNWMGSVTDKEFYEACDKYGIMIWDDFWLNSKIGLPEFPEDFNKNAIEKIKRFRNHPSIVVWCGENEGTPGKYESGENLDENLATYVSIYDAGNRHYQSDSRKGNGLSGSGLWRNYKPSFYFADASNSIWGDKYPKDKGWGLRSEIGTAVFTTFESFKEFMPKESWWPRNDMWNKHFFGPLAKNGGPDVYEQTIAYSYGEPKNIEDFCEKAQLVNLETNKAMFEAWANHLWNDASGIMIWMSQSAYPSFVWQTYDYYYDLTGAFWGAKKGCEPLHIYWNSNDNTIKVTNTTLDSHEKLVASATIYNVRGEKIDTLSRSATLNIGKNMTIDCFRILVDNLALNKKATASSGINATNISCATDGILSTKWISSGDEAEWISIDLESPQTIGNIRLVWDNDNYATNYTILVSKDNKKWSQIHKELSGDGATDNIDFTAQKDIRYIKIKCDKSASDKGYALSNIEVREKRVKELTDVNFIRLSLKNSKGKTVSSNDYWFGDNESDYKELNTIPKADLAYHISRREVKDGKYYLDLKITNRSNTPAFGVRGRLIDKDTGKRILPVSMNANYLVLMPKEIKYLNFEFDDNQFKHANVLPLVKQYMFKEELVE